MATRNRTYTELVAQIEALTGQSLTGSEATRRDSLINLAASRAKRATDYWERWLVVDEPRTVSRGFVQTSEDSFHVYGAGLAEANGLYQRNGTADGVAKYTLYGSNGTDELFDLERNTVWEIYSGSDNAGYTNDTLIYSNASTANTPPLTGWIEELSNSSPAPLLNDVSDIEAALYWRRTNNNVYGSRTYEFSSDTYGLRPWGRRDDDGIVYVTYVKPDTNTYGDGEGGTTSSIPEEWFNYISLYVAYMMQAAQRQSNNNPAYGLALREVENALYAELMRLETQGTPRLVQDNVASRVAYQDIL